MKMHNPLTIPLEAQYLYRRGLEMRDRHKEDVAAEYLKQAVFIAPEFSKAYLELGNCLARLGRMAEASVYLGKMSRKDKEPGADTGDCRVAGGQIRDPAVPGCVVTGPVT